MPPQAVILLGGKGTRIAAQFPDVPKALVPVAGRPFLEWQLDWLRRNGIRRVHLAAGHKAEVLAAYLAKRPAEEMHLSLSREPAPLGTGGALKFVEPFLATDPFLVLNGDSLAPRLDFSTVWKKIVHSVENPDAEHGARLFAAPIEQAGRYGTVDFPEGGGPVAAFREKQNQAAGWINTGIYLIPRSMLALLPAGQPASLETGLFPALVRTGRLEALPAPPPLLDMGTPDGLAAMAHFLYGEDSTL
ncbi:MAG: NTP transferase domain-containing protein [Verrucomicrobiota bacterium]|jgi:D-glycero-alpha-D-manno-heptose 1-phosphate guanylyltransferase|nr:NTP transferase domain-containing protein [Verrucomicrobiota bacterium]